MTDTKPRYTLVGYAPGEAGRIKTTPRRMLLQAIAICVIAGAIAGGKHWQILLGGRYAPSASVHPFLIEIDRLLAEYLSGDVLIVDARPREQYEAGHVAGAIHFDFSQFQDNIAKISRWLPPDDMIVIVGTRDGGEFQRIRQMLTSNGFKQIKRLEGPVNQWSEAGGPMVQGWDMQALLEATR